MTFGKAAGPAWLKVAADGTLSGTPGGTDIGANSFTVVVNDGRGGAAQAALQIYVQPGGKPRR